MDLKKILHALVLCIGIFFIVRSGPFYAQAPDYGGLVVVRPEVIDDVLLNPGIGFMTFQRFNGDELNPPPRWTEGFPIEYQEFDGDLTNKDYPQTTLAYFRVNWRFVEPEKGEYNWIMIDKALNTAAERGQTLLMRISPYEGDSAKDVPAWYREMVGESQNVKSKKWNVDPEDPRFLQYFGGMIEAFGQRYDGHPGLESVDISFVGYWGEGDGMHLLSDHTRIDLVEVYLNNFKKTDLIFQPLNGDAPDPGVLVKGLPISASWPDGRNNGVGTHMRNLGWRIDCLGDRRTSGWCHMLDVYPQHIVKSGMSEAWKKAPVTMEICGTFTTWLENQKYDDEIVQSSFDKALEWHVSSFNAKSSRVPDRWKPMVDEWLKKMGYRYALRKLTYSEIVKPNGQIAITSWWENKGVAPCYKDFKLAFRLKNKKRTEVVVTDADIRTWLPGDIVYDDNIYVPVDMPAGTYELDLAIVSPYSLEPAVKLAIEGIKDGGWYSLGEIEILKTGK